MVVFFRAGLFSDALLQVFLMVFTFYGWWHWWRGVRDEGEVRVVALPQTSLVIALVLGVAGTPRMLDSGEKLVADRDPTTGQSTSRRSVPATSPSCSATDQRPVLRRALPATASTITWSAAAPSTPSRKSTTS